MSVDAPNAPPSVALEPYVGPRPFTRADEALFFGRERESRELAAWIAAHQAVLLYSQSGAGKSSLLAAGVVPLLEKRGAEVLGPARVRGGRLIDGVNVYTYNALTSLGDDPERSFVGRTFEAFLSERPRRANTLRVVLFDQFEELFTTTPERWTDRAPFLEDLGAALDGDPSLRIVFAMREEYLANLDPHLHLLPERLRTRMRLERLELDAAVMALEGPVERAGRRFKPGVAEQLARNLLRVPVKSGTETVEVEGEFVEPVQLQVVGRSLWEALPPDVTEIDERFVEARGDVDEALAAFYAQTIADVSRKNGTAESELRAWFGRTLITRFGTRGTVLQEAESTGAMPNAVVNALEEAHLVRADARGGARWYELTHDRLIGPIRESNRDWAAGLRARDPDGARLEERFRRWVEGGKQSSDLLHIGEMWWAWRWIKNPERYQFAARSELEPFFRASAARVTWWYSGVGAIGLAAIFAWATWKDNTNAAERVLAAQRATSRERGELAVYLAKLPGKQFDALALGIRGVAQDVLAGHEPPVESVAGLRAALAAVGDAVWLRDSDAKSRYVALARDGEHALTLRGTELVIWDTGSGRALWTLPPRQDEEWLTAQFGKRDDRVFAYARGRRVRSLWSKDDPKQYAEQAAPRQQVEEDEDRLYELRPATQDIRRLFREVPEGARVFQESSDGSRALIREGERVSVLDASGRRVELAGSRSESMYELSPLGGWVTRNLHSDTSIVPAIEIIDARDGAVRIELGCEGLDLSLVRISDDERSAVILLEYDSETGCAGAPGVWDLEAGRRRATLDFGFESSGLDRVRVLAFDPKGTRVAVAGSARDDDSRQAVLIVFDAQSGAVMARHTFERDRLDTLSEESALAVFLSPSRELMAWDAFTNRTVRFAGALREDVNQIDASEDLSCIAVLDDEGQARVWRSDVAAVDLEHLDVHSALKLALERIAGQPERAQVERDFDLQRLAAACDAAAP